MSNDKKINTWHDTVTPRNKAPQPWTVKSGGSWDMLDVQPIPDDMLAELAQRYHSAGAPWNCRSMPLSDADREYMFLLYYSMQGLVARMRQAEARVAITQQAAPEAPASEQQADDEESAEDGWRRLALQFDGHRMQALHHLRAMLQDPAKHAPVATEFLCAPPLSGEAVLASRIATITPAAATVSASGVAGPEPFGPMLDALIKHPTEQHKQVVLRAIKNFAFASSRRATVPSRESAPQAAADDAAWEKFNVLRKELKTPGYCDGTKYTEREAFGMVLDAQPSAELAAHAGADTERISAYMPGQWFDARTLDEMQAFYLSRLPAIREAAQQHGYAIGLHGSTRRDFDLMAMQWREGASEKDALAHTIAVAACGIAREGAYQWEQKPNGRFAVSLPICWTDHNNPEFGDKPSLGHIDLSVIDPNWMILFIEKRAEDYLRDHAETDEDTGAPIWHCGEAGREYHSTLVELADDLRAAMSAATEKGTRNG